MPDDIRSFEDQDIFADEVFKAEKNVYLYAGSIRSGKTIICLNILNIMCLAYPGSRWCVIRKDSPSLEKTTIPSYFKYCYLVRATSEWSKGNQILKFRNGSEIMFMAESFDRDPDLDRFKGLEVNGFLLEQIEELQEKTYLMALTRMGQWAINPMPKPILLANSNPAQNWVKTKFYDPWRSGTLSDNIYLQVADIHKNPYITKEYIELLKKELPSEMFNRFVCGNWDATDERGQLIPWDKIHAAKQPIDWPEDTIYMGVDIGRDGPDPSIWLILKGRNVLDIITEGKTKGPEVRQITERLILEHNIDPDNIVMDSVGLGGPIIDEIQADGYGVYAYVGGSSCNEIIEGTNFHFKNLRSFCGWMVGEALKKGELGNITHQKLISDLGAIKYEIKGDKEIYIQSKDEFRKNTGRSSDYWDALYMANWARIRRSITPLPSFFVS